MPPWKAAPHFGAEVQGRPDALREGHRHARRLGRSRRPRGRPRATCRPSPASPTTGRSARPTWSSTSARISRSRLDGDDIYRCFVVPTNLPEDQYVTAIEYRLGNRRVVHHILAYVDVSGEARKRDAADPGPGYSCFAGPGEPIHGDLGGWAPGNQPSPLPDGIGRSLPKGADVIVQLHYHPSGKPETDRTRIGLHFARKPIRQTLHWTAAAQPRPGAAARRVQHRGQGRLAGPRRPRRPRRDAPHAPARPRHRHVGHLPRRPRPGPDQDRRLGLQLAVLLLLREAARPAQGLRPERRLALRQLGVQPAATPTSRPSW